MCEANYWGTVAGGLALDTRFASEFCRGLFLPITEVDAVSFRFELHVVDLVGGEVTAVNRHGQVVEPPQALLFKVLLQLGAGDRLGEQQARHV